LEFGNVGFCGGRKTRKPGEKPLEQGENQQQTQPTYGTRPELNPGHIGGKQRLSSLHHPCSSNYQKYMSFTSQLDVPAEPWSYPQLPSRM